MKLLFDANLSPALVGHLQTAYPGAGMYETLTFESGRTRRSGSMRRRTNSRSHPRTLTFANEVSVEGFPPKVVWLDVGNAGTMQIAALLRKKQPRVEQFGKSSDASVLILSLGPSAV